jgi:uncharacterized protein YcfJ
MNKSMITGAVAGAVIVTAGAAFAGYKTWEQQHYANVVSAELVTKQIKKPRQECHAETVTRQQQPKDEHRVAGTLIGAAVGGVLGNQVGGGNGKKLATVAGAAAGGYAGNQVQDRMQKGNTYTTTEQRCSTVYDIEESPAGYKVIYEFAGKTRTAHLDHDPGKRLPVENGQVVLGQVKNVDK